MKKFFLFLTLSLIAFTACETTTPATPDEPENNATLIVATTPVEVPFYGGEGAIVYRLEDAKEGEIPTVVADQEWVNNFAIGETITFNVEFNYTTEARKATVAVSYGEYKFDVEVSQEAGMAVDVEFVAGALNGQYYGTAYSVDPNYFAILSKNGTTGWSDLYLDTYYRFDIYSATPADSTPAVLPLGVYTLDTANIGMGETFGQYYSVRLQTYEDGGMKEFTMQDGVVVITEDRIEAIIKFNDGEVHRVIYEGSLALSYLEFPEPDYYTTLTEDYTFNHTNGIIRFFHYGDYYGIGASNWTITLMLPGDPINGDYFMLDLVTDGVDSGAASDDVIGTYTCVADATDVAKNTFVAGGLDGVSYEYSWYQYIVDNFVDHSRRAPLAGGSVTIAKSGTGYLVTLDCLDDNGNKIQGTFDCPIVEMY